MLIQTLEYISISLLYLINDVLDLAKIESGEFDMVYRRFLLADLLEQVSAIMRVRAKERGLNFEVNYGAVEKLYYLGDEGRIRQILINLIGNALKFTHAGSVSVDVKPVDGEICFSVKDSGIGIPEEHLGTIFQKFQQVDNSKTRRYGGSGLGLAISQKLAALMGGRITVKSVPGEGSEFVLIVPDNTQGNEDAVISHSVPKISGMDMAANPEVSKKRVLVAEDFENNLVVIKYFMENLGIPYDIAQNGEDAVALYKQHPYDFVLMDVQMPGMDGLEATRAIRAYERSEKLPPCIIVAMTAHAMAGDSARCIAAGMNDYLSKPLLESDIKQKFSLYFNDMGADSGWRSQGVH